MKVLHAASTPGEDGKQRKYEEREKEIKREKESGKRN